MLGPAGAVDGGDKGDARIGARAGAVDHLLEHGLEVEARTDPHARSAQGRKACSQRRDFVTEVVVRAHRMTPGGRRRIARKTAPREDDVGQCTTRYKKLSLMFIISIS